jgi:ABC-type uncharacterized transport system auxiliary subunit
MKNRILAAAFICLLVPGACSPFKSNQPPMTLYTLQAPEPVASKAKPRRIIAVAEPEVPPGFDTHRMAVYMQDGRRLDYAAGAGWPGPLPKVLQDYIIRAGNATPGLMAVSPDSGMAATHVLLVKVNHLEAIYGTEAKSPPRLKASLSFTLLSSAERIISNFTLAREKMASANSLSVIVGETEGMLNEITEQAFLKMRSSAPPRTSPKKEHQTYHPEISSLQFHE